MNEQVKVLSNIRKLQQIEKDLELVVDIIFPSSIKEIKYQLRQILKEQYYIFGKLAANATE